MKLLGIVAFIASGLMLTACGGGSSNTPGTINGNWTATLTGSQNLGFTTTLTETSGSSVDVTNFAFTTQSPCFSSGTTATGTFTLSGDFNGNVSGSYGMAIQSGVPSGNQLTLQGTVNNNVISGTWTLTGITQGCSGSGNFTMNKM